MQGKFLQLLTVFLMTVSVLSATAAGGYAMEGKITGPAADVAITVEPFSVQGNAVSQKDAEKAAREILERFFPLDYARSAQIRGKVSPVNKEKALFELNALFLYRETYTAVTHRVLFSLSGGEYSVVSVDGGK